MSFGRQSRVVASLGRIRVIAGATLGEALRMRLNVLLGLLCAALVLASVWLREFNFGTTELKFLADFGLGALGLCGTLLAALATAHLFFNDVAGGVLGCYLTRRLRRSEYIWGKLAGIAALLALFIATLGGLVALLLLGRAAQLDARGFSAAAFAGACALQWLKLSLVAAMTLTVCSYAGTALFASCTGLLLAGLGHFRPLLGAGRGLGWLRFWPDLGQFDPEGVFAADQSLPVAGLIRVVVYWAAYVALCGGISTYVFRRREF